MSQHTVQDIEESIQANRHHLDLAKALERLESNRDFKQVIQEGFLNKEAVRLVHLKADPAMQSAEKQASIVKQIDAIGSLLSYFRTVYFLADQASKAIADAEELRDEILSEETERA